MAEFSYKERHKRPERKAYMREYLKKYYERNREKMLWAAVNNYLQNREAKLAYHKKRRDDNSEEFKRRKREAYYRDIEKTHRDSSAYMRGYYLKNREKVLSRLKAWRDRNIVKVRAQTNARWHKRRALEKLAAKNLEQLKEYVQETRLKPNFVCYYCEQTFPISKLHFDHVVPLSKGGPHSVDNLCTACEYCNCSKGHKMLTDWIKDGQQIFPI